MSRVLPVARGPRPPLAFDNVESARNDANGRRGCTVIVEHLTAHVARFWSMPLERPDALGLRRRGAQVEVDPCPARGLVRPTPFYDWAVDPEVAA